MQQHSLRRVYVHGAGRRGASAWPLVAHDPGAFLSFAPGSSIGAQTRILLQNDDGGPRLLLAHSIGAVPVVLAAATGEIDLSGLVLVEPALYDIARGDAAVERHIAAVTEARAQASDGNLRGCWGILRPLMFGGAFDEALWPDERSVAERWSTTNVPWGHGVRAGMLDDIPTLIVTGGWSEEYERIAGLLAARGAEHVVLTGAAHRPQDAPGFREVVGDFEAGLS